MFAPFYNASITHFLRASKHASALYTPSIHPGMSLVQIFNVHASICHTQKLWVILTLKSVFSMAFNLLIDVNVTFIINSFAHLSFLSMWPIS